MTCPAFPFVPPIVPLPPDEVLAAKRVSTVTGRFLRVPSSRGVAAQDVLAAGDGLKVRGIHARPVAAQVVDLEALGDRPDEHLIRETVREDLPLAAT